MDEFSLVTHSSFLQSAEKLSWSLFENFSRITKYARQATKVAILGRGKKEFDNFL